MNLRCTMHVVVSHLPWFWIGTDFLSNCLLLGGLLPNASYFKVLLYIRAETFHILCQQYNPPLHPTPTTSWKTWIMKILMMVIGNTIVSDNSTTIYLFYSLQYVVQLSQFLILPLVFSWITWINLNLSIITTRNTSPSIITAT